MHYSFQRLPHLLMLVYLLLLGLALSFFFKYPPLADYVEWVYQSYVLSDLVIGLPNPVFYIRDYPVPYVSSQFLMAGLNPFFGPMLAGKLVVVIYFVLAGILSKRFVDHFKLDPVLTYPLLLCCIICNSSFWSGYINYQFGLLVLMAYVSLSKETQNKFWLNAMFALLAFASHGFCLVAFTVIAGSRALTQGFSTTLKFFLACLPAFLMTVWYMAVHDNDAMPPMENFIPYFSFKFLAYKVYTLTKAGPYQNFMLGSSGDLDRIPAFYYPGVALNVLVGAVLVFLQYRAFRRFLNPETLYLSMAALVLGLAYLLAPALALQVVNPGERVLYPQLICVFAVALTKHKITPTSVPMKSMAVAIYVMLVCAVTNLVLVTARDGYETMSVQDFSEAKSNPMKVLYWHRPYQFGGRYEYMAKAYESNTQPNRKIIFPTGLIANTSKTEKPIE